MTDNKFTLFRKKSMEKIESPEALDDYLQVTSPGVWLVLAAVIIFLVGVCIWGVFGHIDSTINVAVVAENGQAFCLVPEIALSRAVKDQIVKINNKDYELTPDTLMPEVISEETNIYWIMAGNLSIGDIVYRISLSESPDDGVYSGTIVTETLSPVSLLLN